MQQGYKQTEVGVIPTGWDVCTLETLYNITSSKRVFQSQWRKSGIPFYRAREIAVMSEGKNAPEDLYIDTNLYDLYTRQYGSIKKDDVLITGVGTLGKVYVVKEKDRFYFKDGNIIWLQTKGGFSSQYLKYQYDMPVLINQVFGNAGGSTVATYTITNAKVTKVPVPPLEEQNRIAEALSDVDGMIFSLEKLIAKKKAVKQGAMQELLTGKNRLPGFTGEWDRHKLGEYVDCVRGVSYNGSNDVFGSESNQTIRLLRSNNIQDAKFDSNDVQYIRRNIVRDNQILKTYDIMICMANGSKQLVGKNCIFTEALNEKYTFGAFMSCLRAKKADTNMNYMFDLLNSTQYWNNIALLLSGSSINNLRPDNILEMEFKFPSIAEQAAIASILSDMDNEIEALEQKLEKTRQVKQGMMQQLLTGKIRLV